MLFHLYKSMLLPFDMLFHNYKRMLLPSEMPKVCSSTMISWSGYRRPTFPLSNTILSLEDRKALDNGF
jgi:hypothetical protein